MKSIVLTIYFKNNYVFRMRMNPFICLISAFLFVMAVGIGAQQLVNQGDIKVIAENKPSSIPMKKEPKTNPLPEAIDNGKFLIREIKAAGEGTQFFLTSSVGSEVLKKGIVKVVPISAENKIKNDLEFNDPFEFRNGRYTTVPSLKDNSRFLVQIYEAGKVVFQNIYDISNSLGLERESHD